jgi:hypothetical protein
LTKKGWLLCRLTTELVKNHEIMIRVYVTQAFLPFKDSSKLFGPNADWYIKTLLDGAIQKHASLFCVIFRLRNDHFTKTGSGQT